MLPLTYYSLNVDLATVLSCFGYSSNFAEPSPLKKIFATWSLVFKDNCKKCPKSILLMSIQS